MQSVIIEIRKDISRFLLISFLSMRRNLNPISKSGPLATVCLSLAEHFPAFPRFSPLFRPLIHSISAFPPSFPLLPAKSRALQRQSTSKLITFELKLRFKFCYVLLGFVLFGLAVFSALSFQFSVFRFSVLGSRFWVPRYFCGHSYLVSNDSNYG